MLDIVIPIYSRFDLLEKCLDSLPAACSRDYTIYAVNDNSPEGVPFVKKFFENEDKAKVHHNGKNYGFPRSVNIGARKGSGKYVLLLNSDVQLLPGSLDIMIDEMESDPFIGAMGAKLLFPPEEEININDRNIRPAGKIQHVGVSFNIHGRPHHIFIAWDENHPKPNSLWQVPAVTGAVLLTPRKVWNQLRGMSEEFGRGTYEDIDYCFRVAYGLKKRVVVNPDAVGYHYVGASSASAEAKSQPFQLEYNHQLFYNKWKQHIKWTDGILL